MELHKVEMNKPMNKQMVFNVYPSLAIVLWLSKVFNIATGRMLSLNCVVVAINKRVFICIRV